MKDVVIAPGTGLGTALLLNGALADATVLPLEGGHVFATPLGAAHPEHDLYQRLYDHLSRTLYDEMFFLC